MEAMHDSRTKKNLVYLHLSLFLCVFETLFSICLALSSGKPFHILFISVVFSNIHCVEELYEKAMDYIVFKFFMGKKFCISICLPQLKGTFQFQMIQNQSISYKCLSIVWF